MSYGSSTVKPDLGFGLSFRPATRPPNDGPFAFSRIPRQVWDKPRVYLNENIFDTWIFTNFSTRYNIIMYVSIDIDSFSYIQVPKGKRD